MLDLRVPSRNSRTELSRSSARGRASCLTYHWCASKHLRHMSFETPKVSRLFAAGARSLRIYDLPEHRQAPLQALEKYVIQGFCISAGLRRLADGALQARRFQASRAQRVQARQQLGALGLGLAAWAAQKLEFLLHGLLRGALAVFMVFGGVLWGRHGGRRGRDGFLLEAGRSKRRGRLLHGNRCSFDFWIGSVRAGSE